MSVEENKALVQRWFEEFNRRNLDAADEIYASEYSFHEQGHSSDSPGGPQGLKLFASQLLAAFPDWHVTAEDVIAEGDRVVCRFREGGTHKGMFEGIPATGQKVTVGGVSIYRVSGGKLAEEWEFFDSLGLLQQLGVVPAAEEADI